MNRPQKLNRKKNPSACDKAYHSTRWKNFSEWYRSKHPLCEPCERRGITTPAAHTHHKIKLVDDPHQELIEENFESVCRNCHAEMD